MKILIGVKNKHIGEEFRDKDFADEIHILAKGEADVNSLSKKLKAIRKVLEKHPFKPYQIPSEHHIKLQEKFGDDVFNMVAYDYKFFLVTEADLI
ncbi:MAG: hypothetical protein KatS3mg035_1041 [Bacteroidia bacterium]|nr:MAG: hypothetical protein KatS3mg035_1041 [Bacteroidia bacterium]